MAEKKANDEVTTRSRLPIAHGDDLRFLSHEEDVHVYGYGQFQRLALLCSLVSFFMAVVHTQTISIMARPVDHWCKPPDEYASLTADEWKNSSIPKDVDGRFSRCTRYDPPMPTLTGNRTEVECDRWDYDAAAGASIIKEFDLVCERTWLLRVLQSIYMIGGAVLLPVLGSAADKYGRRLVLRWCLFGMVVSGLMTAATKTLLEFAMLQLLTSASITSFQAISTVLLFEVTPQDHRLLLCTLNVCLPLALGPIALGLIGKVFAHWTAIQLVVMSPTLLLLLTFYLTEESPRWLKASWKFKDAERVVLWAARVNGLTDLEKVRAEFIRMKEGVVSREGFGSKPTIFGIIKSTAMRTRSLIVFGVWFVIFNTYYTIAHNNSMAGNAVAFHLMIGITNVFTQTSNYMVLKSYGRRNPMSFYMLALSTLMISQAALVVLEMELEFARLVVATVVVAEVAFATSFVFTVEVFPTAVRSAGMCGAFLFGRMGGMTASLLDHIVRLEPPLDRMVPTLIGGLGFLTFGLLVLYLPDTSTVTAADSVQGAPRQDDWKPQAPMKGKPTLSDRAPKQ